MKTSVQSHSVVHWLTGGGEVGELIRAFDWSVTSLGTIDEWPQSLRTALDMVLPSPVPMALLWGVNGIVLYNDSFAATSGSRHPHLLGSPVLAWPEVAHLSQRAMDTCARGATLSLRDEPVVVNRNGVTETIWVNIDYSPIRDESGRPAGVLAVVMETTERLKSDRAVASLTQQLTADERLRAGQALREVTARQAALLSLGDRLRDLNDTDEIILLSSEILGRTLQVMRVGYLRLDNSEAGAMRLGEWLADGAQPTPAMHYHLPHATHHAEVKKGLTVVLDNIATDPRTAAIGDLWRSIDVAAAVFVPIIEHGSVVAVLRVHNRQPRIWTREETDFIRDIADRTFAALERTRALAALRQSEQDLRLITDDLPALISYLDKDLVYRFVNRGYEDWLNVPRGQIVGKTVSEVFGGDEGGLRLQRLRCALAGQYLQYESSIVTPDGKSRDIELRMTPRYDADGAVQGLYVFVLDISARKRAEAELQRLNDSLEQEVAERTSRLHAAEEQLRQSHKMEAIGQLTGGIAHDFNNILQGIIGGLEAVRRRLATGRSDGIDQFMDAVLSSAHRAAGLTHRLLAFSRRQSLDVKAVDVNLLVRSLTELIRRTLGENHRLELDLSAQPWPAETDANQLESALLNLAINARDAMGNGGTLTIGSANVQLDADFTRQYDWLHPGDYVALRVSDTGSGMTPEVLQRAFDPFFTTKPIGAGTGLGLSMIYGFVRQSHGHVSIDSSPNMGTTVSLYLPRSSRAAIAAAAVAAPQPTMIGADATVLIVEDDRAVRLVVRECLRELGYRTLEAIDGPAAVEILLTEPIDLLVTDVGLPGMNGRQVAEVARNHHPDLDVLFMTGYEEGAVQRSGFLDQGMALIIKPFSNDAFISKVREAVRH